MKPLRAALFLLLAAPSGAHAGEATLVSRELPLRGARTLAAREAPMRFNLVGLHWQGSGAVRFRTRALDGRWRSWEAETDESPDPRNGEGSSRRGWRLGEPYWTGPSDRIEYRTTGRVRRLRAHFVWSPPAELPLRRLALTGAPPILPRLAWGANETLRRAPPRYAPALEFAVVHHTAGSSGYRPADSAAMVRAIQLYHVKGNGWNDVGYNFLVDKYGRVFEGRRGGTTRNVIGAHAGGFNTGSVGVAVIGNHESAPIGARARAALVRLLAWRLDVAHVDPLSTLTVLSGGNARFPPGVPVFLRAVSGHRDTGFTSCPGGGLYRQLGRIAASVARTGLPKLYDPVVRKAARGRVHFSARLSTSLLWSVTVRDARRRDVAYGSGAGTRVAWTWNASRAPSGRYSYVVEAGPDARPVTGSVRIGAAPQRRPPAAILSGLSVAPPEITPNGDGIDDVATVTYRLGAPAFVTASVVSADGLTIATLFTRFQPAGTGTFLWGGEGVADGVYTIALGARTQAGRTASARVAVAVTRANVPERPPPEAPVTAPPTAP